MPFLGIKTKKEREKEEKAYLEWLEEEALKKKILAEKEEKEKQEKERFGQERLVLKFKNNSRTKKAAEDFAKKYIEKISRISRASNEENLSLQYGFGYTSPSSDILYFNY